MRSSQNFTPLALATARARLVVRLTQVTQSSSIRRPLQRIIRNILFCTDRIARKLSCVVVQDSAHHNMQDPTVDSKSFILCSTKRLGAATSASANGIWPKLT